MVCIFTTVLHVFAFCIILYDVINFGVGSLGISVFIYTIMHARLLKDFHGANFSIVCMYFLFILA